MESRGFRVTTPPESGTSLDCQNTHEGHSGCLAPLPLVIWGPGHRLTECTDNIIAVLERSDRVSQIGLMDVPKSCLEDICAAVQGPFPKLTHLLLSSSEPVIPDSFLGGSAPRLHTIVLDGILFPGLSKLLLSVTHLVHLRLLNIPHSGYISPETMATILSTLPGLEHLCLEFQSPQSFPDQKSRRPPPLTRSILPVLADFTFKGVSEYLEYFVARIDAPQLNRLYITIVDHIVLHTPQVIQFVNCTPKLKALEKGHVIFGDNAAWVKLYPVSPQTSYREGLAVKIPCSGRLDQEVWYLERVITLSLPPLSALEDLYIYKDINSRLDWQDKIENAMWLELLHPFPAVKNVYLCGKFAPRIIPALQEFVASGSRATEMLPNLQNIFLEELHSSGFVQEGIREFIAARHVGSHHIGVSRWDHPEQDKISVVCY